ncbi:hypothetical protein NMY3_00376 [Candidatus Nitrosocosmicus oleophilus]|uniref:Uncharacterized protein n=1 Tax=Candidatus Nitrosocosmicus oleophilus TaxID=1353260 RepID=A0A654LUV2_9ARCH|nr:hypothetical protein [Candidatus Nitrosocosmicus oleophilus]ALI34590.1 hypothetical protein NMY3_00376 [Candidatus Nitrosocosmicus oleophilus]
MNDNSEKNNQWSSTNSDLLIWKPTKTNGEWTKYDEIEEEIREKLKPEDGFKTIIDQMQYSVKINPDKSIVCFRNLRKGKLNNPINYNSANRPYTPLEYESKLDPIESIRLISLDKFDKTSIRNQWRVSEANNLCIIDNKPHVILIKRGTIPALEEGSVNNEEESK